MTAGGPGLYWEFAFREQGLAQVAGLDEAGRGAWAGPVAAGAAIFPLDRIDLLAALDGVRDSKLCSPRQRDALDAIVRQNALAAAVGLASAEEVDELRIAPATRLAMRRALDGLAVRPDALIIDYVRLREIDLPQHSVPHGEHESISVAAASILAKVARDRLMVELDSQHPGYGWAHNKGYGTASHRAALDVLGPSPLHRRSFTPIRERLAASPINNR